MRLGKEVNQILDGLEVSLTGTTNSETQRKHLQGAFDKGRFGIKFIFNQDLTLFPGMLVVSGTFAHWRIRQPIEIIITSFSKRNLITPEVWAQLKDQLSQTIQHELIHRDQCSYMIDPSFQWEEHAVKVYAPKARDLKTRADQEYFGAADEIDAYGHCVMLELKRAYPRTDPRKWLRKCTKIPAKNSPAMADYLKAFGGDTSHPVIKRLLKSVVKWIEYEERQARKKSGAYGKSSRGSR